MIIVRAREVGVEDMVVIVVVVVVVVKLKVKVKGEMNRGQLVLLAPNSWVATLGPKVATHELLGHIPGLE